MSDLQEQAKKNCITQFLISMRLVEQEDEFRSLLVNISDKPEYPSARDLTVACVGQLMVLGGIPWPVVMKTINHLASLTDNVLSETTVVIVNGAYLYLEEENEAVSVYSLSTLSKVDPSVVAPNIISNIYTVATIWDLAQKAT